MNQEEIQAFSEKAMHPLSEINRLSRCVDGRYENISDMPMVAKPGADAGDVMAVFGVINILNAGLSNQQALDLVVNSIGGEQNFRFHTDSHASESEAGMGCGHIKQAKLDPAAYGVTQEQMDFLFAQLPNLLERGAKQEVLQGDHAEQAVIVVDSETHGLEPLLRTDDGLQESFIYQKTLHTAQLEKLAVALQEAIASTGRPVELQQVIIALNDTFGKQLTETLKRLASGLPVYTVKIDENGTVVVAD